MLHCVLFLIYISDKSRLQQYLKDGYKEKLAVTLLPDWEQLPVSEIFTQSILVCDGAKQNKEEEKYRKLGTYKELFYNNDVLQKRVVLLGEAGAGKTTFSKHLTDVWCESSTLPQFADVAVLKEFDYLFYVSCRFANKEESILDMITKQLFNSNNKKMLKVGKHVLKNHPEDCLVLIDGADELKGSPTSETGRRGDIVGLPSMAGVDGSVILITSRPWRFYALSKKTQDSFMRIKINGIENVEELSCRILEQLEDPDPRQSSSTFLRQVREKDMYELMKIPLMLLIALGIQVDGNSLHKSMCINYINMLQSFIRRSKGQADWPSSINKLGHLIELENKWELQSNELPALLSKYKPIQRHAGLFLFLGHLAFDLLVRENEQSLVFSKAEFKSYLQADEENNESIYVCLALGILSKTETTRRGLLKMESYAFCHKTFQEFFAALWLASKYENEKLKLYKCLKNLDDLFDYEMLIIFLCGIDPKAGKAMWLDLAEDVQLPLLNITKKDIQKLVCKCMKQQEFNPIDQASEQIYFCINNIEIDSFTSDEDQILLRHVLEEYSCNVKSLSVELLGERNVFGKRNVIGESNVVCEGQCISKQQVLSSVFSWPGVKSLASENLYGRGDHSDSLCPHELDLNKYKKLERLALKNVSVEGLLLPVERDRLTSLTLYNVTMTDQYLEKLFGSLSSYSCLEKLYLELVKCSEQSHSCCLPVLDLQKHNKLKELRLWNLSVKGLLLPVERDRFTSLWLDHVTMNHRGLEQLSGSLSSCSGLEKLCLSGVKCSEQGHSCCLPVLDLQKHIKLKELYLEDFSVKGLLLPVESDRLTSLHLINVTMTHHGLERLSECLSSFFCLEDLNLKEVRCNEQSHSYCLPVLDLHNYKELQVLFLVNLTINGLLLPVERNMLTSLYLADITMTQHGLKQLSESLRSYSGLEHLRLNNVRCSEQSHSCCLPLLDLQKHNELHILDLRDLSVDSLLMTVERDRLKSLYLSNVTMTHRGLEQLAGSLSSCSGLEDLYIDKVSCSEHSNMCCLPALDLQKHNKLHTLDLRDLSVVSLLMTVERDRLKSLYLSNVTMTHRGLEQLAGSLSSYPITCTMSLKQMRCSEHSATFCQPVIDFNNLIGRR